mmetsp:Transcript_2519/g.6470  ORF Transcript_2519/g.6470 Transcript_2519/m.6470 type:complete len:312 (-) Transcript_2519:486-1421(-)|eukprot:CAMPEP_0202869568 /NCGR_PEP_ID=MMETSP1391-20130828/12525_1 /ASSEMBLY_ACC=CAM_ASM_000867 /TAXON_ID=1034604 /ORGANISM="Chlamydomonas leiostraca, Strain SAG 11-49" /LENGTH=311 /DNA_ID=CAMNT_0049549903 /DNA_START=28 /DNA_END=963 /DNA_ORIENTATION=-
MSGSKRSLLVTGASTGIGKAIAKHYVDKGYQVFATVRKAADGEALKAAGCDVLIMDVTDEASVEAAAKAVQAARGDAGLDLLVCNAGISAGWAPVEITPADTFRRVFETNVVGVATCCRLFLPLLRRAAAQAKPLATRILIVSSAAGKLAGAMTGPYCMSKHAVEALGDTLRGEVRDQGIHVALIEPGVVRTEILNKAHEQTKGNVVSLPASLVSVYKPRMDQMVGLFMAMEKDDIPMETLLSTVDAALLGTPYARYPCDGRIAFILWVRWALPDWAWDWLSPKLFNLQAKKAGVTGTSYTAISGDAKKAQ